MYFSHGTDLWNKTEQCDSSVPQRWLRSLNPWCGTGGRSGRRDADLSARCKLSGLCARPCHPTGCSQPCGLSTIWTLFDVRSGRNVGVFVFVGCSGRLPYPSRAPPISPWAASPTTGGWHNLVAIRYCNYYVIFWPGYAAKMPPIPAKNSK